MVFCCIQVEGVQDIAAMGGTVPSVEQRDELDDPLAAPDVDKYIFQLFQFMQHTLSELHLVKLKLNELVNLYIVSLYLLTMWEGQCFNHDKYTYFWKKYEDILFNLSVFIFKILFWVTFILTPPYF